MPKKKPVEGKPEVHPELDGFEVSINEFGEIVSNTKVDVLNDFLNKHVDDKKFKGLDDIPVKNAKKKTEEEEDIEDDEDFDDDDDDEMDDEDLPEEDELVEEDEKDPYELDEKDPDLEDIEELVKSMEKDFGKRGVSQEEEEETNDFQEEEFLDEYNDDFSEEDNYNFDDGDSDERY
ncbi:MAG: hypothetical protein ACKVPJ_01320 [Chitinophagales bacterium]